MIIDLTMRRYMSKTHYDYVAQCTYFRKHNKYLIFEHEANNVLHDGYLLFEVARSRQGLYILNVWFNASLLAGAIFPNINTVSFTLSGTHNVVREVIYNNDEDQKRKPPIKHDDTTKPGWFVKKLDARSFSEALTEASEYLYLKGIPAIFYKAMDDSDVKRVFDNKEAKQRYESFEQWYKNLNESNKQKPEVGDDGV